jgi:hypothetical protein
MELHWGESTISLHGCSADRPQPPKQQQRRRRRQQQQCIMSVGRHVPSKDVEGTFYEVCHTVSENLNLFTYNPFPVTYSTRNSELWQKSYLKTQ